MDACFPGETTSGFRMDRPMGVADNGTSDVVLSVVKDRKSYLHDRPPPVSP